MTEHMSLDSVIEHLRVIASRGHTTDEDNQWLFDVADFLENEVIGFLQ